MKSRLSCIVVSCIALAALGLAADQPKSAGGKTMADHILTPDMVKWGPGPASLPSGAEAALLDGDMAKAGSEFTVRLRVPDGWKVAAHFHPKDEHVTVLQGAFWMGMGDKFDEAALKEMPAGGFHKIPKGVHHFGMAKGQTVIQLHGVGAWGITYVNPADDPRTKSAKK